MTLPENPRHIGRPPFPVLPDTDAEKILLLKIIDSILAQFDNKESEIPDKHYYWMLVELYRGR